MNQLIITLVVLIAPAQELLALCVYQEPYQGCTTQDNGPFIFFAVCAMSLAIMFWYEIRKRSNLNNPQSNEQQDIDYN